MIRRLVVLGGGTAGTMVVNKLRRRLPRSQWEITVVDRDDDHLYQPGLLLLPFGVYEPHELVRSRHHYVPDGVELVLSEVEAIDREATQVRFASGRLLPYDYLVVATGTSPRPDQTPGMLGPEWGRTVHDFYTLEGAVKLRDALARFDRGRLVVHVTEMPVKCPVAPLELAFLAEAHLAERGVRSTVDITYVTPLDGAFTRPVASERLGGILADRGIQLETDFMVESIDQDSRTLASYDGREVPYDLLVTVPVNMGADVIARSGMGDELNYVRVDPHTLVSREDDRVFALGDASDIPASKAGSVAHFSVEVFAENFLQHVQGLPMTHAFDGHANCFIETGHGKASLIDFNYDTEPLEGTYPLPGLGPFSLLGETHANHLGKLAFRWAYWNVLLRGLPMPVPTHMSLSGKKTART